MTPFATSQLSRPPALEHSRGRKARSVPARPWRGANRSLSRRGLTARPRLEVLEDRTVLSTFLVVNTGDNGGVNPVPGAGTGTLRQAIIDANAAKTGTAANPDLIKFAIPGSGMQTISLAAALPTVTDTVLINGYSQPGSCANKLPNQGPGAGDNAVWTITLDGTLLSGNTYDLGPYDNGTDAKAALDAAIAAAPSGLVIAGGNSAVSGLVIQNFSNTYLAFFPGGYLGVPANAGSAIHLTSSGNTVSGNYITTTADGVFVDNVPNNTIGGTTPAATTPAAMNLIRGSTGVQIQGPGATGNKVEGNFIGLAPLAGGGYSEDSSTGTAVVVQDASDNVIGAPGAGNVIAGDNGISLFGVSAPASGNLVQGNYIGTTPDGTAAAGTAAHWGIEAGGLGTDNTIGGTPAARNLISGWRVDVLTGVNSRPSGAVIYVEGNYIGTDANGTYAIDTGTVAGIVTDPNDSTSVIADNLVSGNGKAGIWVEDTQSRVQGNLIGTNWTGTQPIRNGAWTVGVKAGSNDLIGGTGPGQGNVIAFNNGPGVEDIGTGFQIEGNSIYSNAGPGVWVQSDPFGSQDPFGRFSDGVTTGVSIQRNSIYGNGGLGISLGSIAVDANGNPLTRQQVQDSLQSNPGLWDHDEPSSQVVLNDSLGHVGANNFQNFPVLDSVTSSSTSTVVTGTFSEAAEPDTTLTLDFYANPAADPSGYGQGQTYLGSRTVVTDGNGNVGFTADLAVGGLTGDWISATATDQNGNTSEFSQDIQATSAPNQTFAQGLPAGLPQSITGPNTLTIQADTTSINDVVSGLSTSNLGSSVLPVSVYLNLAPGTYQPQTIQVPQGMTLYINGQPGTTIDPSSSAFAVVSGNVVVSNATFVTTGDAPTIRVTGGRLTLRNDVVQESTGYAQAAIEVDGGTVDLGTPSDPGGNTLNVNGAGAFVHNFTSTPVPATGDTFTVNGLPLTPSSLSGVVWEDFNGDGQVDFGEQGIGGVQVTLAGTDDLGNAVSQSQLTDGDGAYVFLNLRPGNYYLTETQPAGYPQGVDSVGTAGGSLAAADQFFVQLGVEVDGLNYNYGEQPPTTGAVQKGQAAGVGFWNNRNGQALIKGFNGGTGTQLADWLAATLPHIFGIDAGANDLAGKSNAFVAALFQQDFVVKGIKLDAQVLATALSVYATNATLDSTAVAAKYGFTVSGDGLGTDTWNVGSDGDAFGVANNTRMTVMDLLLATDAQAVTGILYNGNSAKRKEANDVFSSLNQAGGI